MKTQAIKLNKVFFTLPWRFDPGTRGFDPGEVRVDREGSGRVSILIRGCIREASVDANTADEAAGDLLARAYGDRPPAEGYTALRQEIAALLFEVAR